MQSKEVSPAETEVGRQKESPPGIQSKAL